MLSLRSRGIYRIVRSRDGSLTLWNRNYKQCYKSTAGAVAESRHVYLDSALVTQRLLQSRPTRVLEIGLGTGLNFLLSASTALRHRTPIHYVSLERNPVPGMLLQALDYDAFVQNKAFYKAWLKAYSSRRNLGGQRTWTFCYPPFVSLELFVGDAVETIDHVPTCEAIYLDAFSPNQNPELWSQPFLTKLAARLSLDGRMTTYCVQRTIRERLQASGLTVEKVRGPTGGKREILTAFHPYNPPV